MPAGPKSFRWGAIAAGIAIAFLGMWLLRQRTIEPAQIAKQIIVAQPAGPVTKPDLTELARYDPPRYDPPALRGQSSDAQSAFAEAMQSYLRADYSNAAQKLRAVTSAHPAYTPAHFFLGASELLLQHGGPAIAEMNRVLQDRESPFHEEARWAMAKSLLLAGDTAGARTQLSAIASADGDLAPQARDLMRKLEN
jgi:TolA-binding protein